MRNKFPSPPSIFCGSVPPSASFTFILRRGVWLEDLGLNLKMLLSLHLLSSNVILPRSKCNPHFRFHFFNKYIQINSGRKNKFIIIRILCMSSAVECTCLLTRRDKGLGFKFNLSQRFYTNSGPSRENPGWGYKKV